MSRPPPADPRPAPQARAVVPLGELVDLAALRPDGTAPTPRELRGALPRGWVLCEDGVSARRDLRLLFREGWILVTGLVVFGFFALTFFADVLPRGGRGLARFAVLVGLVALAAGIVAPRITRALYRR